MADFPKRNIENMFYKTLFRNKRRVIVELQGYNLKDNKQTEKKNYLLHCGVMLPSNLYICSYKLYKYA